MHIPLYTGEMTDTGSLESQILGAAFRVHRLLGPGRPESAYREQLLQELKGRGLFVEKDKPLPRYIGGLPLDNGCRADLLAEQLALVEVRAVDSLSETHVTAALGKLIQSGCPLCLLLNFRCADLRKGIKKLIR